MDGALKGTSIESFPKPTEIGGSAGVPAAPPPPPAPPQMTVIQPTMEVAPGITIPVGPPTTVPVGAGAGARAAGSARAGTRTAAVTDRAAISPRRLAADLRSRR